MKKLFVLVPVTAIFIFMSCEAPKEFMNGRPRFIVRGDTTTKVEYYETDFEARQKDYLNLLMGDWTVSTMQRQARLGIENLNNTSLKLNPDKTFAITSGCSHITGNYSVKGTSIKFNNAVSNNNGCTTTEQENELMRLLTNTVSAYTVSSNSLLLRDGSTNIVFKAGR
jgi:heat shock protein HslJ